MSEKLDLIVLGGDCPRVHGQFLKNVLIVVTAGPAGAVLAAGLARSAKHPLVLLLEAGGEGLDDGNRRPYDRYMNAFTLPHLDHGYSTVSQPGLGGRIMKYQYGKGLGGSTMINFLVYAVGPAADWNRWAKLVGDQDWAQEHMKERFRQIETFHDQIDKKFKAEDYGYDGPLHISMPETEIEGDF